MPKKQNTKPSKNTNSRLHAVIAVASFVVGTIIGCVSLFWVPPPDDISNSELVLTSDFLLMSSAMLGVNVVFDYKLMKFKTNLKKALENNNIELNEQDDDEQDEK